jgi:azurin
MSKQYPNFAAGLALAALLLAGCGQSTAEGISGAAAAAPAPAGARTLQLTADDTMKFSATTLEARPGEALRLVFKNTGRMPKQAMAHNWVLLKPGTEAEVNAYGMAAASAAPTYLPADRSAQVIAHTGMLGPGETDTLDFTAPAEPGEYPFVCTFPGHFALMKGKLIVR